MPENAEVNEEPEVKVPEVDHTGKRVVFVPDVCFWLIAECPSGVIYQAQAGGIACLHPEIEGAVVEVFYPVPGDDLGAYYAIGCNAGCGGYADWNPERIAAANMRLGTRGWKLDAARLDESYEGWWYLERIKPYPDETDELGDWQPSRVVMCGPNCD